MSDGALTRQFDAARQLSHIAPLRGLREKTNPAHCALIVIDMQNDFCARGGLVDRGGRDVSSAEAMAGRLPDLIETARRCGVTVVFVRSVYSTDRNEYLSDVWLEQAARKQGGGYTLSPVCQDGEWGGDYYDDVRPAPGDVVVTKHRYSAFYETDLNLILRSKGVRSIVLTGVSTNVCIETTARDGFIRDFYTILVDDGTAAYSAEEHQTTLKTIDRFFGEITTIAALKDLWNARNS